MDTNGYEQMDDQEQNSSLERRLKLQNMATSIAMLSNKIRGGDKQGSKSVGTQGSGNGERSK
jgi:hypothetical protein